MNKGAPKKKDEVININLYAALVVAITFVLLLAAVITLCVCLAVNSGSDEGIGNGGGGGGGGVKQPVSTSDLPVASMGSTGAKTGIVLPCATKAGTYLSASGSATDISTDTNIKSGAAVLVDVTNNTTVASKYADTKIYPASMTKVMTLLVACENAQNPNTLLTLTKDMVNKYSKIDDDSDDGGPSLAIEWKEGYQVTVEDALYMIIYKSDTYACWLVADYVAGNEENFVELMNKKASELGLSGTHFKNCTGLYDAEHYTTCREMAAIMAAAMNNETAKTVIGAFKQYFVDIYKNNEKTDIAGGMWCSWYSSRLEKYPYISSGGGRAIDYVGHGSDVKFIGGKTGYETIPQACFVTAGLDDKTNRMYVCVQVGRINEEQKSLTLKDSVSQSTNETRYIYYTYELDKND